MWLREYHVTRHVVPGTQEEIAVSSQPESCLSHQHLGPPWLQTVLALVELDAVVPSLL